MTGNFVVHFEISADELDFNLIRRSFIFYMSRVRGDMLTQQGGAGIVAIVDLNKVSTDLRDQVKGGKCQSDFLTFRHRDSPLIQHTCKVETQAPVNPTIDRFLQTTFILLCKHKNADDYISNGFV